MRRLEAFIYAAAVYGLIGLAATLIFKRFSVLKISNGSSSVAVILVSAKRSKPAAKQTLNVEAASTFSKKTKAKETKEDSKAFAKEPTPPQKTTKEAQALKESALQKSSSKEPPRARTNLSSSKKLVTIDRLASKSVELLPPKPLKAPTHFDPKKMLALKAPLIKPHIKAHRKKRRKRAKKRARALKRGDRLVSNRAISRARSAKRAHLNRLLAKIKRRIARNKSYPIAASRRHIEGRVRLSFTVTRKGAVRNITVRGPRIFAASARAALRRAFPVSVGKAAALLPRRLSVVLVYRLR